MRQTTFLKANYCLLKESLLDKEDLENIPEFSDTEVEYDKVDKVRGMDIIFVTTAKTDEEARELLRLFNMPFEK